MIAQRSPGLDEESALVQAGYRRLAGVDEAGRGALAGPVVAAAVILPLDAPEALAARLTGVRDSKLLTPGQREGFFDLIHTTALAVGTGVVSPQLIDAIGIARAAQLAMRSAIGRLGQPPDYLLLDAFELPNPPAPQRGIIHGDRTCLSIAAASIIAKVTRDRLMIRLDEQYPGYGLARHKGYGTRGHRLALYERGPSPIHRFSYAPVRRCIAWGALHFKCHGSSVKSHLNLDRRHHGQRSAPGAGSPG